MSVPIGNLVRYLLVRIMDEAAKLKKSHTRHFIVGIPYQYRCMYVSANPFSTTLNIFLKQIQRCTFLKIEYMIQFLIFTAQKKN